MKLVPWITIAHKILALQASVPTDRNWTQTNLEEGHIRSHRSQSNSFGEEVKQSQHNDNARQKHPCSRPHNESLSSEPVHEKECDVGGEDINSSNEGSANKRRLNDTIEEKARIVEDCVNPVYTLCVHDKTRGSIVRDRKKEHENKTSQCQARERTR